MDNKEIQIITQVCAKIAADLTTKDEDTQVTADRFGVLLSLVTEMVFDTIDTRLGSNQPAEVVKMVQRTFPTATEVAGDSQGFTVNVQGEQHGELPAWLIAACKRDGVTRVFDNRNQLAENPKRPWFKAVGAEKAYWEPKGKARK
jgi:hypothetical protein